MNRRHDWPERLAAVMADRARSPFAWGSNDCALFAADCAQAMTGEDLAAAFRGRYRTARGAARALRRAGYADLPALLTAWLGDPIRPTLAQRGDVVEIATGIAVANGAVALAPGDHGLVPHPVSTWQRAWRVARG